MIKTFIKTGDIKAEFDFCNNLYSIAHAKVSEGSFEVEFREIKQSKTYLQLKAIHKLCEIYGDYMTEALGRTISFENAKESLKYAIDYTRLANENEAIAEAFRLKREKELQGEKMKLTEWQNTVDGLKTHYKVPASFKKATLQEMQELIEKIHELGRDRGWHKLILTNQEIQSMINYYVQNR
jgi:hypothetical protein